jgi:tRNA-2-methylthio-N6-dimethylallyladenosine synthase
MSDKEKKPLKYLIFTFGCQMNERDTETIAGMLEAAGYIPAAYPEEADVIILNTCSVRKKAENRVLGRLGELKRLKKQNPNLIIGVSGCMAQRAGAAAMLRRQAPHVSLVIGTHNLHRLPDLINQIKLKNRPVVEVWPESQAIVEHLPACRQQKLKAYVNITYGCNNFCSYCIVPYVRGRERSRQPQDIIAEITELGRQDYKEITLLGQNVNAYGKDLIEKVDFADLLAMIDRIPKIERIRYMTSHPRDFSSKLIEIIAGADKVCEHFHLPVQSGSNQVLQRMHRGYNRERYLELVALIRENIPGACITTDIIVGFPGETDSDFLETLDLVKQVRFDAAYTFIYSPRQGTPAAGMPDQVPDDLKKSRLTIPLASLGSSICSQMATLYPLATSRPK